MILGPAVLNILQDADFITKVSEVGVIVLMFTAGMETDVRELKKTGKASFIIALCGVLVPLWPAASFWRTSSMIPVCPRVQPQACSFRTCLSASILTATSVSITVETLKEMGKLNTRAGNAILGAAIIDDILGIVALTIITSLADESVQIGIVLLQIVGFFVFAGVVGFLFFLFFRKLQNHYHKDCAGSSSWPLCSAC